MLATSHAPSGADADRLREALDASDGPIETRETHGSVVFLTGTRAYKLKKALRFDFADLRSLDARRRACLAELDANRQYGNDHVFAVLAVVPTADAYELAPCHTPEAVDYVVAMHRFAEDDTLAARIRDGRVSPGQVEAAGRALAARHRMAEKVHDAPSARFLAEENFTGLTEEAESLLGRRELHAAERFAAAFLLAWGVTLEARRRTGRVIDGHGDVRAEHLLLRDDGSACLLDRLEHRHLRVVDVADELAFLRADLVQLGSPELWDRFLGAYVGARGERPPDRLVAYFAAYRCWVRAKVALVRGRQTEDAAATADAAELLTIAARFAAEARGPVTMLVTGPPASGKSTLAARLADLTGLPILASDLRRADVATGYDDASRCRVYASLAGDAAARGGCIVDATFGLEAHRRAFIEQYASADVAPPPLVVLACQTPEAMRLTRAAGPRSGGSEAGPAVAATLGRAFTPFVEVAAGDVLAVNGAAPAEDSADLALAWLDRRLAEDLC